MKAQPVDNIVCPQCEALLDPSAELCLHCGAPTSTKLAPPAPPSPPESSDQKLLDNPWIVLALLFLVLGALGLPLLWKSRAFGGPVKIVLGVVVTVYTGVLLWLTALVVIWSHGTIMDALQDL